MLKLLYWRWKCFPIIFPIFTSITLLKVVRFLRTWTVLSIFRTLFTTQNEMRWPRNVVGDLNAEQLITTMVSRWLKIRFCPQRDLGFVAGAASAQSGHILGQVPASPYVRAPKYHWIVEEARSQVVVVLSVSLAVCVSVFDAQFVTRFVVRFLTSHSILEYISEQDERLLMVLAGWLTGGWDGGYCKTLKFSLREVWMAWKYFRELSFESGFPPAN